MKTPLILVTGFLGAGKTTFINNLITDASLGRTALIINEFGDVNIDAALITDRTQDIIELTSGCVCCMLQDTLADTLAALKDRAGHDIDRVIIETTGLANTGPLSHLLMSDDRLKETFRFDRIVTIVDAMNGLGTLNRHPESVEQIAVADVVLLTKTDLVVDPNPLLGRISHLNPTAARHVAPFAQIALEKVFELQHVAANTTRPPPNASYGPHDRHIRAITLQRTGSMTRAQLDALCASLGTEFGANMLRIKGLVKVDGATGPAIVHGTQGLLTDIEWLESWPTKDQVTTLVFIGWDLDEEQLANLVVKA